MEEIEQERTDICAPGVVSELQEVNQPAKEYSDLTVPSVSMEEPQVETEIEEKVASPESSAIQGSSAPCSQNDSDFNRSTDGEGDLENLFMFFIIA